MNVIGYTETGMIRAEFDDTEILVPDDMGNRHRQLIAEWEFDEEGERVNTIPPYVAPLRRSRQFLALASGWRRQKLASPKRA